MSRGQHNGSPRQATKKKIKKVVRPTRSPWRQWPLRRMKNGDLSIVFFSWVGRRTYQHPCKLLSAVSRLTVCLYTLMERLGSQRTDFHEIWFLSIFRKPVEEIQVSFKSDKNNGYFTWRKHTFFIRTLLSFTLKILTIFYSMLIINPIILPWNIGLPQRSSISLY